MLRKDLRLAYRNPMVFGLLVLTPFLMMAVLSEAFSPLFEGRSSFDLPVVDLAQSDRSAQVIEALDELESIRVKPIEWDGATFDAEDAANVLNDSRRYFSVLTIYPSDKPAQNQLVLYSNPAQPGLTGVLGDTISSRLALESVTGSLHGVLAAGRERGASPAPDATEPSLEAPQIESADASGRAVIPSRFEQTVPGFSIMFTFWLAMLLAGGIHVEKKEYRTWRRTLASPAPGWMIIGSRVLAYVILGLSQMLVLFLLGGIFFGIGLGWNLLTLVAIFIALSLVTTSLGFLMISLLPDMALLSMVMNLLVIGMAVLGGALVPVTFLPGWAEKLAVITPHYWAMDAIQEVIILDGGLSSVSGQVGVLLGFSAVLFFLGSLRFRLAD
jgi:ABC-2 type transport system permease protein